MKENVQQNNFVPLINKAYFNFFFTAGLGTVHFLWVGRGRGGGGIQCSTPKFWDYPPFRS